MMAWIWVLMGKKEVSLHLEIGFGAIVFIKNFQKLKTFKDMMDQYGMEMEYGGEHDGMMGDEMMDDGYGQEYGDMEDMDEMGRGGGHYGNEDDGEDDSLNFEEHPEFSHLPKLDRMRKIRREIMKTINDAREKHGVPSIYVDTFANKAANEYAAYLLQNPEDNDKAQQIADDFHVNAKVVPLVGFAILEADEEHQGTLPENMMDAHGLLLELEHELGQLCSSNFTHIGVGFAFDNTQVKVVELLVTKPMMIHSMSQLPDGGLEARGIVLDKTIGLYAARIASLSKLTKDLKVVGPQNIQYQKLTGDFVLQMPGPIPNAFYCLEDLKVIQFYYRTSQIDKIQYGVESNERINVKNLVLAMTLPVEQIPDPRTVLEDQADLEREVKDRELRIRRAEEEKLQRNAQRMAIQAEREKQRQALLEAKAERGDESGDDVPVSQSKKSGRKSGSQGSGD